MDKREVFLIDVSHQKKGKLKTEYFEECHNET